MRLVQVVPQPAFGHETLAGVLRKRVRLKCALAKQLRRVETRLRRNPCGVGSRILRHVETGCMARFGETPQPPQHADARVLLRGFKQAADVLERTGGQQVVAVDDKYPVTPRELRGAI